MGVNLRDEHRLRVFEKRVLMRVCGPKREEPTRSWRKMHNDLYNLYFLPNIIRVINLRILR
jgi:hypothetical protein